MPAFLYLDNSYYVGCLKTGLLWSMNGGVTVNGAFATAGYPFKVLTQAMCARRLRDEDVAFAIKALLDE